MNSRHFWTDCKVRYSRPGLVRLGFSLTSAPMVQVAQVVQVVQVAVSL